MPPPNRCIPKKCGKFWKKSLFLGSNFGQFCYFRGKFFAFLNKRGQRKEKNSLQNFFIKNLLVSSWLNGYASIVIGKINNVFNWTMALLTMEMVGATKCEWQRKKIKPKSSFFLKFKNKINLRYYKACDNNLFSLGTTPLERRWAILVNHCIMVMPDVIWPWSIIYFQRPTF